MRGRLWLRFQTAAAQGGRFRQVDKDQPSIHHDALELPDGQIVKVTKLRAGQHATVLQMPVSPREITPAAEPHDVAIV